MKNLYRLFLLLMTSAIILPFFISACSEEVDCSSTSRNMMYAGFFKYSQSAVKDTLDSLTVTALGTDSIILNKASKVTSAELPLRWTADSTFLIFHYTNNRKDTIKVWHTNTPTFISMDCGYSVKQVISKVLYTKHVIDSVYVAYKTANTDATQNIRLYY